MHTNIYGYGIEPPFPREMKEDSMPLMIASSHVMVNYVWQTRVLTKGTTTTPPAISSLVKEDGFQAKLHHSEFLQQMKKKKTKKRICLFLPGWLA